MTIYTHNLLNMMDAGATVVGKKLRGQWVYTVDRKPATDAAKALIMRGMVNVIKNGNDAVMVRA